MKSTMDIVHEGTMGDADRTRMSFHSESIAHLMSVLTDLYRDPELAIIREYSTNAADSHIEAGVTRPIEITLPTYMNPTLSIKDFGVGMTADEIRNNYSQYGYSSKRDTDEQVGMLGLGCKSALAHTSQFTIVAIKDGIKTLALITREGDGAGTIQIIHEKSTSEPNGVEVLVPMKNPHVVQGKAMRFFQFWDPGTVLVNGAAPHSIWNGSNPKNVVLDPDVVMVAGLDSDYVVMGNVGYPIKDDVLNHDHITSSTMRVVARVPIGTVNFTPSREALMETSRTRETVEDIRTFVNHKLTVQTQATINKAASGYEALRLALSIKSIARLRRRPFTYRGNTVPTDRLHVRDGRVFKFQYWQASKRVENIMADSLADYALVVTGFPNRPPTDLQRKRIDKAVDALNPGARKVETGNESDNEYILVCGHVESGWFKCPTIRWSELKDTYKIPEDDKPKKAPVKVKVVRTGGYATDIDMDDPLIENVDYWLPLRATNSNLGVMHRITRARELLGLTRTFRNEATNGVEMVFVSMRSINAFRKKYPHVPNGVEYCMKMRWMLLNKLASSEFTRDVVSYLTESMNRTAIRSFLDQRDKVGPRYMEIKKIENTILDTRIKQLIELHNDLYLDRRSVTANGIFMDLHSAALDCADYLHEANIRGYRKTRIRERLANQQWPIFTRKDAEAVELMLSVFDDYPLLGHNFVPNNEAMHRQVENWITKYVNTTSVGTATAVTTMTSSSSSTSYTYGGTLLVGGGATYVVTTTPAKAPAPKLPPGMPFPATRQRFSMDPELFGESLEQMAKYLNTMFLVNNGLINPAPVI